MFSLLCHYYLSSICSCMSIIHVRNMYLPDTKGISRSFSRICGGPENVCRHQWWLPAMNNTMIQVHFHHQLKLYFLMMASVTDTKYRLETILWAPPSWLKNGFQTWQSDPKINLIQVRFLCLLLKIKLHFMSNTCFPGYIIAIRFICHLIHSS